MPCARWIDHIIACPRRNAFPATVGMLLMQIHGACNAGTQLGSAWIHLPRIPAFREGIEADQPSLGAIRLMRVHIIPIPVHAREFGQHLRRAAAPEMHRMGEQRRRG
jgi:hypothetical protein